MIPITRRRWLSTFVALPALHWSPTLHANALPWRPQLAREAAPDVDPTPDLVSEKLDGVRALWDGQVLRFRSGGLIAAPAAFTAALPSVAMDGELWLARGQFERLVGTVRRERPDPAAWQGVTYQVFDLPTVPGPFAQRAATLAALAQARPGIGLNTSTSASANSFPRPWGAVAQHRFTDRRSLQAHLQAVLQAGGEGLMLHRADAHHAGGRSLALLKLKPVADAEAQVLAHLAGQGKHAGRLGALRVRCSDGHEFNLGIGLRDADREAPPAVGQWVTYTYRGRTAAGLPRFASFLRLREV